MNMQRIKLTFGFWTSGDGANGAVERCMDLAGAQLQERYPDTAIEVIHDPTSDADISIDTVGINDIGGIRTIAENAKAALTVHWLSDPPADPSTLLH